MAQGYAKATATITATPVSLDALLAAEGYTGSRLGKFLRIGNPSPGIIYRGTDSGLTTANGIPIGSGETWEVEAEGLNGLIDAANIWLRRSVGSGDFELTWEPA